MSRRRDWLQWQLRRGLFRSWPFAWGLLYFGMVGLHIACAAWPGSTRLDALHSTLGVLALAGILAEHGSYAYWGRCPLLLAYHQPERHAPFWQPVLTMLVLTAALVVALRWLPARQEPLHLVFTFAIAASFGLAVLRTVAVDVGSRLRQRRRELDLTAR